MINSTLTSRPKLLRLLALCMSFLLTSCSLLSWFDSKKGSHDDDEYINWTAQHFYQEAKKELMDGNYDKSVKLYEKLEARYPFDKLATQAQLEVASAEVAVGHRESIAAGRQGQHAGLAAGKAAQAGFIATRSGQAPG